MIRMHSVRLPSSPSVLTDPICRHLLHPHVGQRRASRGCSTGNFVSISLLTIAPFSAGGSTCFSFGRERIWKRHPLTASKSLMSHTRFSVLVRLVNGPEWRTHPWHEFGLLTQISRAEQFVRGSASELVGVFIVVIGVPPHWRSAEEDTSRSPMCSSSSSLAFMFQDSGKGGPVTDPVSALTRRQWVSDAVLAHTTRPVHCLIPTSGQVAHLGWRLLRLRPSCQCPHCGGWNEVSRFTTWDNVVLLFGFVLSEGRQTLTGGSLTGEKPV